MKRTYNHLFERSAEAINEANEYEVKKFASFLRYVNQLMTAIDDPLPSLICEQMAWTLLRVRVAEPEVYEQLREQFESEMIAERGETFIPLPLNFNHYQNQLNCKLLSHILMDTVGHRPFSMINRVLLKFKSYTATKSGLVLNAIDSIDFASHSSASS